MPPAIALEMAVRRFANLKRLNKLARFQNCTVQDIVTVRRKNIGLEVSFIPNTFLEAI